MALWLCSCGLFGYLIGCELKQSQSEKEILELSIELKKLEIKKLIKDINNE